MKILMIGLTLLSSMNSFAEKDQETFDCKIHNQHDSRFEYLSDKEIEKGIIKNSLIEALAERGFSLTDDIEEANFQFRYFNSVGIEHKNGYGPTGRVHTSLGMSLDKIDKYDVIQQGTSNSYAWSESLVKTIKISMTHNRVEEALRRITFFLDHHDVYCEDVL